MIPAGVSSLALMKLMREKKPKKEAPTKDAVAADAMADTENRVPMLNMVLASSMEVIMFWLA
jgi:hypothetical protein